MPRVKQNAQKYIAEDFVKMVRVRMAYCGIPDLLHLAKAAGLSRDVVYRRMRNPDQLTAQELRQLNSAIKLDPTTTMKLIGISG